ncbi:hypothetical protein [Phenylobacterium sp.]|uniref:hypothetical protein n=1 Tax=Phenylobacterium sp. TaxID=1871053 RepID=UPI002733A994|nr:hypothetical protein [Phenylobacterium sp.]MDP3635254.1 hypothetical protein [Phenylobacterium sp.]
MAMPPDAIVFAETLADIVRESGVMGAADVPTPGALEVFPESFLLDSLQVMRRIGIDPEEAACLCAIYMGIHQALVLADADPAVAPWSGDHSLLVPVAQGRLAVDRLGPLFLLFETGLGEQMMRRRQTMN